MLQSAVCVCVSLFCLKVLPKELSSQRPGVRPEPLRPGVQAAVAAVWHRRQPGPHPAGGLHAGRRDAPSHHLPGGGRGHDAALRPAGREHEGGAVHHEAAAGAAHVPHEGASALLQRERRHRVPDNLHRLHRRLRLPLLRAL